MEKTPKQLRIFYAAGPEDVIGTYRYWTHDQDAPSQVSVPYCRQFYEVCQAIDAKAYIVAPAAKSEVIQNEQFTVKCRPVALSKASGLGYHLGQIWNGLGLLLEAIKFRSDLVIVSSGTTHWFLLSVFSWLGLKVIPSLHCVLWRKYATKTLGEKLSLKLSGNFFASQCQGILAVSHDIIEQVAQLTGGEHQPSFEFFPQFRRDDFANISPPSSQLPLQVLFAGRIEENKGVFDLLEIAKRFACEGRRDIIFDICGEGTALDTLRLQVKTAGVDDLLICHGYCTKPQMRQMFAQSHVAIVPTRTDFVEGFNRVVCESILSGRPVVTSGVCPALSYVREAVIEVPPNDIQAYGDALLALRDNSELYEQKRQACFQVQEQFYDPSKSWGAGLKSMVLSPRAKN